MKSLVDALSRCILGFQKMRLVMQVGRQIDKLKIHDKLQMLCTEVCIRMHVCLFLYPQYIVSIQQFIWKILEGGDGGPTWEYSRCSLLGLPVNTSDLGRAMLNTVVA